MVGNYEKGVLKVDHIALHVDGDNLPRSVADNLVPDSEAREQHTGMGSRSLSRTM
jgi:hypothetical protein